MTSQTMAGSQIQTLGRQGSLYNLTLNEVQSHLTEPLLSMNLDDLLKSIFPEDSPHPTNHTSTSTNLERQGSSSITMPPALSKKTIDEVWRGINVNPPPTGHLQSDFGEMTLESFLLKAGVVLDPSDGTAVIPPNSRGDGNTIIPPNLRGKVRVSRREVITPDLGGREVIAPNLRGDVTVAVAANWIGPGTVIDANGYGSGSGSGEGVDKVMERRQKRMIKNRESAARSRARKQAYTNELENKVSRLEQENERLKKQKVIDKILCSVPVQTPKYQLRRTSSF